MFDLEKAIAAWRRAFEHDRVFSDEDLEELERHLRDHTAFLVAQGRPEADAFQKALEGIGDYGSTEAEYRKVFWEKRLSDHSLFHELTWRAAMLKSYLIIALRNLKRHKGYTFINVAGLTLGLATCLIIGLFVQHKLSYDQYLPNAERVYRVYQDGENENIATTPPGLALALQAGFPEIEHATVLTRPGRRLMTLRGETFYLENVAYADSQFFQVFPFRLLQGRPDIVLAGPNQMVLTRSTARRLFGEEDPIGQTLRIENRAEYRVTGIVEDVPANTHFRFNALLSPGGGQRNFSTELLWNFFGGFLYLALHDDADIAALETKMRAFEAEHRPHIKEPQLRLQPVTGIHLHTNLEDEIGPQSDIRYLYVFSAVGILILVIACINFMNLATARSAERAREIGIRKVVGAHRGQLIGQFLGESALLVLLAFPLALGLAHLAIPAVNRLGGQELTPYYLYQPPVLLGLFSLVLLVGLTAGSYPAFFLSRFRPSVVLTARSRAMGRQGSFLRRCLVVFQFAGTVVLLVGTFVIASQLDYLRNRPLGFDREYIVTFDMPGSLDEQYQAFRAELLEQPAVRSAVAGAPPGVGWLTMWMQIPDPITGEDRRFNVIHADYGYLETLGIEPIAGRSFNEQLDGGGSGAVVLSRSAARLLELPENPIGEPVDYLDNAVVVGLIDELHNASLYEAVLPLAIQLQPGPRGDMLVRLHPGNLQEGIAALEKVWKQFVPDRPFEYAFLDERIAEQYEAEQRLARIFTLFTGLAVLIACLGLFGLAAFSAVQRTKEIGIRKVLGATVTSIVALLSKDFAWLVLVAFLLAVPVAYVVMDRWLAHFAYHVEIGPGVFILAGGAALLIALLTVSYQAIKAGLADPVKSLRYE